MELEAAAEDRDSRRRRRRWSEPQQQAAAGWECGGGRAVKGNATIGEAAATASRFSGAASHAAAAGGNRLSRRRRLPARPNSTPPLRALSPIVSEWLQRKKGKRSCFPLMLQRAKRTERISAVRSVLTDWMARAPVRRYVSHRTADKKRFRNVTYQTQLVMRN